MLLFGKGATIKRRPYRFGPSLWVMCGMSMQEKTGWTVGWVFQPAFLIKERILKVF